MEKLQLLKTRSEKEYAAFKNHMLEGTKEEIIARATEIHLKEEFHLAYERGELLGQDLDRLLISETPLEETYQRVKDTYDKNRQKAISDFVDKHMDEIE